MEIEHEFDIAMRGTYEAARSRGYVPTYFLQMIEQFGGVETAHRLLAAPGPQTGLYRLWELGLLSNSMEALVIQKRFQSLFTDEEVTIAQSRLKELGLRRKKRINPEKLAILLQQEESSFLEFKESIDLDSKEGKGKFLKRILALANSCTSQSFLIIGIEDKTKRAVGCQGITEEKIQQIVNRYCRPPIDFDFYLVPYQDVQIGVIQIYHRYHFHTVKESYKYLLNGKEIEIRDKQVFVRRGSTVDEATPDEIIDLSRDDTADLTAIVSGLDKINNGLDEIAYNQSQFVDSNHHDEYSRTLETVACAMLTALFLIWANDYSSALFAAWLICFSVMVMTTVAQLTHFGLIRAIATSVVIGLILGLIFQYGPGNRMAEYWGSLSLAVRISFALFAALISGVVSTLFIEYLKPKFVH